MSSTLSRRTFLSTSASVLAGTATLDRAAWGEDQVKLAVQGMLESKGKAS